MENESQLLEKLHILYIDHQHNNLDDALRRFLKKNGISQPDKDPRIPELTQAEEKQQQQAQNLQKSYETAEHSQFVYIEFDEGNYFQDPLPLRRVNINVKTVTGIIKTHEGKYERVSVNKNFYIENHLKTAAIAAPKALICKDMVVWEKTKTHKNYQEFDYNFDYDFDGL